LHDYQFNQPYDRFLQTEEKKYLIVHTGHQTEKQAHDPASVWTDQSLSNSLSCWALGHCRKLSGLVSLSNSLSCWALGHCRKLSGLVLALKHGYMGLVTKKGGRHPNHTNSYKWNEPYIICHYDRVHLFFFFSLAQLNLLFY
jgi:hypothetical protein